ncbi:MAG: hypothetical protein AAFR57_04035 [Pseudomonadota bacterium]
MRRLQQGLDGLARLRNAVPPKPMKPSSVTGREPVKGTREGEKTSNVKPILWKSTWPSIPVKNTITFCRLSV